MDNKEKASEKKIVLQLTGKGVAGWGGVFFFISLWMFVLGILVGRGIAPVQFDINNLQKELAELRQTVIKKEQNEVKKDCYALNSQELDFHDTVKETGKEDSGNVHHVKKRRVPEKQPEKITKKNVSKKKMADIKPERKTIRSAKTTTTGKGHLAIQVAALKNKKEADKMADQLKKKGYSTYMVTGKNAANETFFRVRVGNFNSKTDAQSAINKLKQNNIHGFIVNR